MPWKGNEFQWDRDEAYADQLQGLYGPEHDEKLAGLTELENGIRKFYAEKLRAIAGASLDATERHTYNDSANLLDPYHDRGSMAGWHKTTLDDGDSGARGVIPE